MNLSKFSQARELKSKLDKVQKELSKITVEASSAKDAVKITMDGQQKIQSVKISPQVIDPARPEYLEGLVLKTVNEAVAKSQKVAAKQLKELTGGFKIPGLT
jgi:DNA-binding YbaB/EbfC family protein